MEAIGRNGARLYSGVGRKRTSVELRYWPGSQKKERGEYWAE